MESEQARRERIKKEFLSLWQYGHPRFYQLIWEACELHEKKNHGYATTQNPLSNFYECENFGVPPWQGCLVRMSDKWSRLKNLAKAEMEPKVDDLVMKAAQAMEPLSETLIDLGVYSFIDMILFEEWKRKKAQ